MFATWCGLITQQVPLSWSRDSNSVHVSNSLDVQKICPVYINDIQVLAEFDLKYAKYKCGFSQKLWQPKEKHILKLYLKLWHQLFP